MSAAMEYARMSGSQKAAVLVTILGEESAAAILRSLSEDDLQKITQEVSNMGRIPVSISRSVLEEYQHLVTAQEHLAHGGHETANRLLVKAFGESGAKNMMQRLLRAEELSAGRVESLKKADPKQLARLLEGEHPQTIALILGHLEAKQASSLLMHLPSEERANCVRRLANLRQFSPAIAERVSTAVNRRLKTAGEHNKRTYSGFQSVADLMNTIDAEASREILEGIETQDPKLAGSIRELMFTFEDFLKVDEVQLREVSAAIDKKVMAMALKGASEEIKNHFYRTMSSRAIEMMKEDTEAMGMVRNKEVLKAQSQMVATARQLEEAGKIVLASDGGDDYV